MVMVVVMLVLMFMMVMMFLMIVVVIIIIIVIIIVVFKGIAPFLYLLNPGGAGGYVLKVKEMSVKNVAQVYIAVVTLKYAGARLQGAYDLANALHLIGRDL